MTHAFRKRPSAATVSWCLFDFANSSYTTLIITTAFALYFRQAVVNAPDNRADQYWGIANNIAMLVLVAASPFAGALADFSGRKKLCLILTTLPAVAATALLYYVGPGDIVSAMTLFIIGTICFEGGYIFYNAFLPDISTPQTVGRISGWGWAVGYAGGLLCMFLCRPWIGQDLKLASGELNAPGVAAYQASFLIVAAFYLVFAIPAFVWLREGEPQGAVRQWSEYAAIGTRRVADTLRHLRTYKETAKYILASIFFTDGISTVVLYAAPYATVTFGFTNEELVTLVLINNLVALPGALVFGYVADWIGARRTIILTLLLWVGVVALGYLAATKAMFWVMAAGASIGMGATQAVGRSFMAQITPAARESEFFGFYVLSGKFASAFGPLVFGTISRVTGSQRLAVLSLLPFFLLGLAFMLWINEKRAIEVASRETPVL